MPAKTGGRRRDHGNSIKRDRAAFLEAVVTDGRYPSADADVDEALRLFEERERKLKDLRDTIDASIAEGGIYSSDEVRQYLQEARDRRNAARARSDAA